MAVELVPAGAEHMSLLRSLLQFYEYDWSEISGRGAVDEEGRFLAMDPEEFLADAGARAFVIRVGAEPAGFVFVKPYSFFAQTGVMAVSEFFVMRSTGARGSAPRLPPASSTCFRAAGRCRRRWRIRARTPSGAR